MGEHWHWGRMSAAGDAVDPVSGWRGSDRDVYAFAHESVWGDKLFFHTPNLMLRKYETELQLFWVCDRKKCDDQF